MPLCCFLKAEKSLRKKETNTGMTNPMLYRNAETGLRKKKYYNSAYQYDILMTALIFCTNTFAPQ